MKGPGFFFFLLSIIFILACGLSLFFFPQYAYSVFNQIVTHPALVTSLGLNVGALFSWLWVKRTKLAYLCGFGGWLAAFQYDIANMLSNGIYVLNFWLEALKANFF